MPCLKLIAFDGGDLAVLSAHMQNAVLRVGDMAYLKRDMRFALVANRMNWASALRDGPGRGRFRRRLTGLRFERVLDVKVCRIDLSAKDAPLELLAAAFEPHDAPAGFVTLHFADGGAVRLAVECLEAELTDLETEWAAPPLSGSAEVQPGVPGQP